MRKKEAGILIIDDHEDILFSARVWLKKFFTKVFTINHPYKMESILQEKEIDVILLDMNFRKGYESGKEGIYWLEELRKSQPEIPIILMTAYGEINLAVEALKLGAADFILKPWNNDKLYASVNLAVDLARKNKKISQWSELQPLATNFLIESRSPVMISLLNTLKKVAPTDANVLLLGENGTGKYVWAAYLFQHSQRNKEPFVHIDLGAITESLFEAELFGYAKGAFTDAKIDKAGKIEMANGGTVFLDEIGNLSLHLQQKLLSVIQSKRISRIGEPKERLLDIRFIFATNADLSQMVNNKLFREDLYYRINTVELRIPPLRERVEDIPLLVQFFMDKYQKKYQKTNLSIHHPEKINHYAFPGNIRELEHSIERAIILSENETLYVSFHTPEETSNSSTLNLEEMEAHLIKKALKKHQGNISAAAEALGLSRAALYRRMEKFDL